MLYFVNKRLQRIQRISDFNLLAEQLLTTKEHNLIKWKLNNIQIKDFYYFRIVYYFSQVIKLRNTTVNIIGERNWDGNVDF